jgi:hypothetical protein
LQAASDIEQQLTGRMNWALVSNKKTILTGLQAGLEQSEKIVEILDGFFSGTKLRNTATGHSGLFCITDRKLIFVENEQSGEFEAIEFRNIKSVEIKKEFTSSRLVITTTGGEMSFNSYSGKMALRKFAEKIQAKRIKKQKPSPEVKKKQTVKIERKAEPVQKKQEKSAKPEPKKEKPKEEKKSKKNTGADKTKTAKKSNETEKQKTAVPKKKPEKKTVSKKPPERKKGPVKKDKSTAPKKKKTKPVIKEKPVNEKIPDKKPEIKPAEKIKKKETPQLKPEETKTVIPKPEIKKPEETVRPEVEPGDVAVNLNFLFLEAKKINKTINSYKQLSSKNTFERMLINDLLFLSSYGSLADNVITEEEKLFMAMVFMSLNPTRSRDIDLKVVSFFSSNIFPEKFKDTLLDYWEIISEFIYSSGVTAETGSFKLLPHVVKYDTRNGTTHGDRIATMFNTYANCLIKADGTITEAEAERLYNLQKQIHSIKKIQDTKEPVKEEDEVFVEHPAGKKKKKDTGKKAKPDQSKGKAKKDNEKPEEDEETLEEVMAKVNALVGMDKIKEQIKNFISIIKVHRERLDRGMPVSPLSLHAVFYGPPGTGKTTIARLLGQVYRCLGLLEKGHLIETDRSGVVAGYVGQTAIKTDEAIQKALDGVLFIDEAYALSPANRKGNDFGQEAIDIILKRMEDYRERLVIIVAGYPDEMKRFINSNPGLKSRFSRYFYFDHYTPEELIAIYDIFCKNVEFVTEEGACQKLFKLLIQLHKKRTKSFGNGRLVRNLFEMIIEKQAARIADITPLTDEILCTILKEDIPKSSELESL